MAAAVGARLRRTWPQRLLISFNIFLILCCVLGASGLGYFYYRFGQLPRIDLAEGILAPEEPPGEPQNWLLVGSDSREFVEEGTQDQESFGDTGMVGGQRADTIILVRLDPQARKAAMVSFPRDLYVRISGVGRERRINEAFSDGPQQLISTIRENFNVPIHHYAEVDFAGFKGLVEAVGGVEVYLPGPVRDSVTGLNVTDSGCVTLSGDQALAYVRSRHFQYQENGRWRTDPTGDLGRIERQQDFIRRAIREALSKDLLNPRRLNKLIDVAIDNVSVDDALDLRDMANLGRRFRSLSPDTIQQFTLPVAPVRRRGAAVVAISDAAEAERIFDVFRGPQPGEPDGAGIQPASVTVRVLNGSGRGGEATRTSEALRAAQFAVAGVGDGTFGTQRTTILYGSNQRGEAALLARYLEAGATLREDASIQGVDVVLVTGQDFTGVLETPRPPGEDEPPAAPPPEEAPAEEPPPDAPPC